MRLKRLEIIGEYKSIKGTSDLPFIYEFQQSVEGYSPLCLVGLNGSGKSNFIELIADIFGYADRYYNDQYICKEDLTYDFEIDYVIRYLDIEREVRIGSKNSRLEIYIVNESEIVGVIDHDYHHLLPSNIIAYSSGHNQGLSSVFSKAQFQYYEVIRKQSAFYRGFQQRYDAISGREDQSEKKLTDYVRRSYEANPSLFFVYSEIDLESYFSDLDLGEPLTYVDTKLPIGVFTDHSFSQLIFIYLFVSQNYQFRKFIADEIKIDDLVSFDLDLRLSAYKDFEIVKNISGRLMVLSADSQGSAIERLSSFNKDTLSGVLSFTLNAEFFKSFERLYLESSVFLEHLITLSHISAKKWSADEVQSLKTSGYTRNVPSVSGGLAPIRFINTKVKLREPDVETLYDRLSDGEHQLMQVIGSMIMFDHKQSLFILDEPESHFNPEWRMEFIELINKYVNLEDLDLIISTHSPFILSACKSERVLDFKKDASGNVTVNPVDVETYGASFDSLLTSVFDLDVLISKKPLDEIEQILELQKGDKISEQDALDQLEPYGDSFELNYRRNQLRRQLSSQEQGGE